MDEKELPNDQQALSKIYLKAVNPEQQQVEMCVLHGGQVKKHYTFAGQDEEHEIALDDNVDCPC